MESRGYRPDGDIVQVRASVIGGTLTMQKGVCADSADGYCQIVFIFLDDRFLGTDTARPSRSIGEIRPAGTGRFTITYDNYAESDPNCCPSLRPVTITYAWDGVRLQPNGTPPGHS
jgi:hypothetical protein